ncbi:amidohydrolase [Pseudalgibacter alginicilyticus]|uniref:Amidohydrolase n=1 Tax=Pseudalgibacter alginicilyticus TaxID=1736674 RepID=A0A0N7HZ25_9FLAO|nr:amidohydrolase family protein [Pseudalgibacter alginicilyticus]ALJ06870.1 amidohydrolase [Pseudalgibacter alginicilyticus]
MKLFNIYITLACLLLFVSIHAQQTPAKKQTKAISIEGATAHLGNGELIENALIMFEDGKITFIGSAMTKIARIGNIINAQGKHIYPGFIVPNSTLGLVEIDAVKASDDDSEFGSWNPHIRSLIAYNAESKIVESMRPNGVLIGQITPRGGRISGTSSVVQFDAWNWEDAAIKVDDGIHMNWPNTFIRNQINSKYAEQIIEITNNFNNAKAYLKENQPVKNLPYEALKGLFDGTKKLYINADDEKSIIDAINFSNQNEIKHLVIVGGREAYKVADKLKDNQVSVILNRTLSLPENTDDDYNLPLKVAKPLVDNGVLVALQVAGGRMERMNSRNLPFYAGTTVAHGLTKEQALQLITSNPAKILGINDLYGTLEVGKSATLFISEGDALDMRTNLLTHAFIDGRLISLETHQTELWKRYSEKYNNQ